MRGEWHVNNDGEVKKCSADEACPFEVNGGHSKTKREALKIAEEFNAKNVHPDAHVNVFEKQKNEESEQEVGIKPEVLTFLKEQLDGFNKDTQELGHSNFQYVSNFDLYNFMVGGCGDLATALHKQTGWPIVALTWKIKGGKGYHAGVQITDDELNRIVDAEGIWTPQEWIDRNAAPFAKPGTIEISPIAEKIDEIEKENKKRNNTFTDPFYTILADGTAKIIIGNIQENKLSVDEEAKITEASQYWNMPKEQIAAWKLDVPNYEKVLDILETIGDPLVVGGAVRDSLQGHKIKDVDIEVHHSDLDKIAETLKKNGYRVDEVGKEFGVLKVSKKGEVEDLDISVPRRENRVGAGHRAFDVQVDSNLSIQEAGERRDLTFNAMYFDHKRQLLLDPFDGRKDFENKTIRHISEKFSEDPLRVLRAFQFAGRFGFEVAPETAELCRKLRPEFQHLSSERVEMEFLKFFEKGKDYRAGVKALQDIGWDDIYDGLRDGLKKPKTLTALDKVSKVQHPQDKHLYGATVMASSIDGKTNRVKFIRNTGVGDESKNRVHKLLDVSESLSKKQNVDNAELREIARDIDGQKLSFRNLYEFAEITDNKNLQKLSIQAEKIGLRDHKEEDLLTGQRVLDKSISMGLNYKPGVWMGQLLKQARDEQYSEKFRTDAEADAWLQEKLNEISKNGDPEISQPRRKKK